MKMSLVIPVTVTPWAPSALSVLKMTSILKYTMVSTHVLFVLLIEFLNEECIPCGIFPFGDMIFYRFFIHQIFIKYLLLCAVNF